LLYCENAVFNNDWIGLDGLRLLGILMFFHLCMLYVNQNEHI
jgi:hypothetical protein